MSPFVSKCSFCLIIWIIQQDSFNYRDQRLVTQDTPFIDLSCIWTVKMKSTNLETNSIASHFIIFWNYVYFNKYDNIFRLATRILFWFGCDNISQKEAMTIVTIINLEVLLMHTRTENVIVKNLLKETDAICRMILHLAFIVYLSRW